MEKCRAPGCERPRLVKSRSNWCAAHRARVQKLKTLDLGRPVCSHNHGHRKNLSGEYRSWRMMRNRCLNPKAVDFEYYGGRGITICKTWDDFENFFSDMGKRPGPLFTLERINNERGYGPSNCKWATRKEQANNRRKART